ncbi:MAG: TldD/PmbA family protein [Candidatus Omnitrophica bacterium]|nr:TldD/PmbA family protein [Candidatus Omnitrophota bacterium]
MKQKIQKLADRILSLAGSLPIQIFIRSKKGVLARFTNNGVHQNGFQDLFFYTLRLFGKSGFASLESNDGSRVGIQNTLNQLKALEPHPVSLKVLQELNDPKIKESFPFPIEKAPEMAASAIEEAICLIRQEKASANGYYSAYERFFYFLDSTGRELFHPSTAVRFGVTATRGAGKGYSSFYHPNSNQLNVVSTVKEALTLAKQASLREVLVKPGDYQCIFSPRAFLELIEPIRHHFDEHLYRGGKSALSGFLGKRIFSEAFTLDDDATNPKQFGVPFDVEGMLRKKVTLVEKGVLRGLLGQGNSSRGIREYAVYPENLVAQEGDLRLKQLFKQVKRGIFINKIRYHTLVREGGLEVTGLSAAGPLYIEGGEVLGRVGHLRYHDSLFSILRFIVAGSRERVLLKDGEMGAALLPYFLISKLHVV